MNTTQQTTPKAELTKLTAQLVVKQAELDGRDPVAALKKYSIVPQQFQMPQGPVRHNGQYTW